MTKLATIIGFAIAISIVLAAITTLLWSTWSLVLVPAFHAPVLSWMQCLLVTGLFLFIVGILKGNL